MLAKSLWYHKMPTFNISYSDSETLPDRIKAAANDLELTPEELIKRVLDNAFPLPDADSPATPANSLKEFLVANGALKQ